MILQALNDLYERLASDPAYEIAPPGFAPQKISFRIVIKLDGTLVAIEDARVKDDKGKFVPNRIEVPAHEKRTSGVKPQFLCDKAEYLLGWTLDSEKQIAAEKCFEAFKNEHLLSECEINDPAYSALCRFLEKWSLKNLDDKSRAELVKLPEISTNFGVWFIQGEKQAIHTTPKIRSWWIDRQSSTTSTSVSQCLVSGEIAPVCRIHPDIKGFKSSIALVGIQEKTSYESYGLLKTENCPISENVAFRYATALNALTDGPKRERHRARIVDTTVAYWTKEQTIFEDIFADIFQQPSKPSDTQDQSRLDQISRLLGAIKSGAKYSGFGDPETLFFMLGLEQPNPGRFSIRFFHRSTIEELLGKLHSHHKCIEIVRQYSEPVGKRLADPEFPAIWQILRETARDADDIPPLLGGALARSIIEGTPYPEALFSAIIRRIHADRDINYIRAATLKAILTRNHNQNIPTMLDPTNTTPAYLLGRLFAALEKTQEDALGGNINAGVRDRYYSAASATPASVFPRLLRTYQHHLSKLNGGAKVNRDRLVQDILATLDASGFPNQLSLKNQGVFAIGYYHQRKDFFTKKETAETTQN